MTIPIGEVVATYKGDVTDLERKLGIVTGSLTQLERKVQQSGQTISSGLTSVTRGMGTVELNGARAFTRVTFGVQAMSQALQGGRLSTQGLANAMMFLSPTSALFGGIAAGLAIVATGFTLWKSRADAAAEATDKLRERLERMNLAQLRAELQFTRLDIQRERRNIPTVGGAAGGIERQGTQSRAMAGLLERELSILQAINALQREARPEQIRNAARLADETLRLTEALNREVAVRETRDMAIARENREAEARSRVLGTNLRPVGIIRPEAPEGGPLGAMRDATDFETEATKEALLQLMNEVQAIGEQIARVVGHMVVNIASAFGSGGLGNALKGAVAMMSRFFGEMLIRAGLTAKAFGALGLALKQFAKDPALAIGVGVALVALGASLSRSVSSGVENAGSSLASGGFGGSGGGALTSFGGGFTPTSAGGAQSGSLTIYVNALPDASDPRQIDAWVTMLNAARDRRMIELIFADGTRRTA